jgi:hypothetical protein
MAINYYNGLNMERHYYNGWNMGRGLRTDESGWWWV